MKKAVLHPLFVEKLNDYSHLIATENQTKEQFLIKLAEANEAFYSAVKDSLFDTIKINESTVLFNYSN